MTRTSLIRLISDAAWRVLRPRRPLWLLLGMLVTLGAPLRSLASQAFTTDYVWDANRRLTMVIGSDPGTGARPATLYTYDDDGLLRQIDRGTTDAAGANFTPLERVVNTYDAVGNKTMVTTVDVPGAATLGVVQTAYDAADRTVCVAVRMNPAIFASPPADVCALGTPAGSVQDRITKTLYDPAGEVIQLVQGFGTTDQRVYETFCNKAAGWNYATDCYTPNGKLQYEVDANGNMTRLAYDGFDRLVTMSLPASATAGLWAWNPSDYEAYTYDDNGNRLSLRKRDGRFINWCYDALDREVEKYVSQTTAALNCAAVTPPTPTGADVETTYDLLNHKLTASFAAGGSVVYTYDLAGRPKTETTGGRQMAYGYDPAGNRVKVTWPDATPFYVNYAYDSLNHPTAITDSAATPLASFTYDGLGRRTLTTRNGGAGAATTYGFDMADRLTSLGQDLAGGTTNDLALCFVYNPASQVTNRGMSTAAGNCVSGGSATAYDWPAPTTAQANKTYDGLNRDAGIVTSGGYDADGNLTNDGTRAFSYDLENRLLSASAPTAIALTYDPLGRLQNTAAGATQTTFLYDGDRLTAEYDTVTGNLLRRYVHGAGVDEPLAWYEYQTPSGTPLRWLQTDNQGSIIAWSDGTGTAGETYAYGPYGEPRDNSWAGSRFRYTGQITIPEAALYHYKARVYDPSMGRFLQTDPIGYKDDLDLYAYVAEDPIDRVDPTGTQDTSSAGGAGGIMEGVYLGNLCKGDPVCGSAAEMRRSGGSADMENAKATILGGGLVGGAIETTALGRYASAQVARFGAQFSARGASFGSGKLQFIGNAIKKASNIIENGALPKDFAGVAKELNGTSTGFDHVTEMRNNLKGLQNAIGEFNRGLARSDLTAAQRQAAKAWREAAGHAAELMAESLKN